MKHRAYRLICLLLAALTLMTPVNARAEFFGLFGGAEEAPAHMDDGVVRVMLTSLGTPETVNLTLEGVYSVENDAGFRFADGADVTLTAVEDCIYMAAGGVTLALGNEVTLTRHPGEDGSLGGIIIAQAGSNRYCGDLTLWAVAGGLEMRLSAPIEEYLPGVVAYEMSDSFPLEALKAQAVAARTYAMYKKSIFGSKAYDLLDTTQDQVYKGVNDEYANVARAVAETAGLVGYYNGKPAVCYYTASNGGQTALATNVWGSRGDCGYLAITEDPYDLENPKSLVNSYDVFSDASLNGELTDMLNARLADAMTAQGHTVPEGVAVAEITAVEAIAPKFENTRQYTQLAFTVTAKAQQTVSVQKPPQEYPEWMLRMIPQLSEPQYEERTVDVTVEGVQIVLDAYADVKDGLNMGLNGSDYEMLSVEPMEGGWRVCMRRFGHGVGMSQRGAQWMASEYGKDYMEILKFYYPGMSFEKVQWTHEPVRLDETVAKLLRARGISGMSGATSALADGERYARVKLSDAGSQLNMRAEPNTDAEIVTVLMNRSRLIVCESRDDGWSRVRTAVAEGYVKSDYLEIEE